MCLYANYIITHDANRHRQGACAYLTLTTCRAMSAQRVDMAGPFLESRGPSSQGPLLAWKALHTLSETLQMLRLWAYNGFSVWPFFGMSQPLLQAPLYVLLREVQRVG